MDSKDGNEPKVALLAPFMVVKIEVALKGIQPFFENREK